MGESPEAIDSVIGSHTAFTEAAKAHVAGGKVNQYIIDTATTETAPGSYFLGVFFVIGEEVEGQWMRHGIDLCNSTSERIVGKNREYRAEDFLLHDRIIECHTIHDCRLDLKCFAVCFATTYELGGINKSGNAVEMFFVDDLSVVAVLKRLFSVLVADLSAELCNQGIFDLRITVDIVRCYAGLAAVQELAEYDTFAARRRLAVLSTMQGLFPPSSRVTGVRYSEAFRITSFPTDWLPVKKM